MLTMFSDSSLYRRSVGWRWYGGVAGCGGGLDQPGDAGDELTD